MSIDNPMVRVGEDVPARPSIADVHDFLRRRNALIVHFSSSQRMVSFARNPGYPADLQFVVNGGAQSGISCSVVTPTDNFDLVGRRNACGYVGLIIDPMSPDSLLAVSHEDLGSENRNGSRFYLESENDVAVADLEASLSLRTEHNEWGVKDFRVLGVLAVPRFRYWDDASRSEVSTTLDAIRTAFAEQPVYLFGGGLIYKAGVDHVRRAVRDRRTRLGR